MAGLFDKYKIAVLDSSFFVSDFTLEVKAGLRSVTVYAAGTFHAELEQYRLFLSRDEQKIFDRNLSFLRDNLGVNVFDMASAGDRTAALHNDIWGLITFLASLKGNFVVITANRILTERIILSETPADIYDLNTNSFLFSSGFSRRRAAYEFGSPPADPPRPDRPAKEGSTLYRSSGGTVTLGSELHSGGLEGVLYRVSGHPDTVAKIMEPEEFQGSKLANLKNIAGINRRHSIDFAVFPDELLYYDVRHTVPAGFIEKLVDSGKNLSESALYIGNLPDCSESELAVRCSDSLELCLKVVRQVCYLNVFGFYVTDFNLSNFSARGSASPYVQMWDVDSFGYGRYFSGIDAGYRMSRSYDCTKKAEAIASGFDELYLFVFMILSLGDAPISGKTGRFKYSDPQFMAQPLARSRKKLFPPELWELFSDVFSQKKAPSAEALLAQLADSLQALRKDPAGDKSYQELLSSDLSGEAAKADRGLVKDIRSGGRITTGAAGNSGGTASPSGGSQKKKKMKAWHWILLVLLLSAVVNLILLFTGDRQSADTANKAAVGDAAVTQEVTPGILSIYDYDFTGMEVSEAERIIEDCGWTPITSFEENGSVRKGTVVRYDKSLVNFCVFLTASEGGFSDDDVPPESDIIIDVGGSELFLRAGEETTITVHAEGPGLPPHLTFSVTYYPEFEAEWGDRWEDGSTLPLTIRTTKPTAGYLRFYVVDSETSTTLAYTDVFATVQ